MGPINKEKKTLSGKICSRTGSMPGELNSLKQILFGSSSIEHSVIGLIPLVDCASVVYDIYFI